MGHISTNHVIVNEHNYDYYVVAGVSKNEIFSQLLMTNMSIVNAVGFDSKLQQMPLNVPRTMKFIKKDVNAQLNSKTATNISQFVEKYNNIFLKMDTYGDEYLWILSLKAEILNNFKQMIYYIL